MRRPVHPTPDTRRAGGRRRRSAAVVVAALVAGSLPALGAPPLAVSAPAAPAAPATPSAPATSSRDRLVRIDGFADEAVIVRPTKRQARAVRLPVRVRVDGHVTSLVVRLNGHPVTGRRGTYVLDRAAALKLGENQLWVEASIRGRARPAVAARTFYLGYRASGVLSGSVTVGHGDAPAAVARLRLPATGIQASAATVNGASVTVPDRDGTARTVRWNLAQLGSLRQGSNRVWVRVLTRDGRVGVVARTFQLDGRRPVVAARVRDERVHVGATLTLDTSRSRPAGTGRSASSSSAVRWTLLSRPLLSKARLGATSGSGKQATVRLRPDVPGRYLVGVRMGSGSTAGYDVLEVVATYPNPLVPFNTITYPDGGTTPALQLGDQTVKSDGQGIAVYVLDRRSLGVTAVQGYPTTSAGYSALSSYFDTLTDSSMVIVTLPGSKAPAGGSSLIGVIDKIGGNVSRSYGFVDGYCWTATPNKCSTEGSHWQSSDIDTGSFSYIGVPGLAAGQAWRATATRSGTTDGVLHGWLTLGVADQSGTADEYTVIPGTDAYQDVDTCTSDGCAVQIGDQTYAPTAGVTNGMHVVVVDRTTLKPLANKTVTTLTDFVSTIGAGWSPKPGTLFYTSPMFFDDQRLVVLQSIGNGQLTGTVNFINLSLIDLLGGTTETFQQSIDGKHRYALVGAATNMPFHGNAGLESSTVMATSGAIQKKASGQISGIITPNRQMLYTPQSGDPVGPTNNDLYSIMYQPAQAWPYAADTDVLSYIAAGIGLGNPDVRSAYTNANYKYSWGGFYAALTELQCTGQSFCGTEFTDVQSQLKLEFTYVPQVLAFIDNMLSPYIQSGSDPYFNVMNVTNQVSAAVKPTSSDDASMGFLSIFVDSLFVGDAVAGAAGIEAEPFIGLLASSLSMASDMIQTPDGGSASTVNSTAEQLASQMADQQTASVEGLDRMQDILLTDWGRLHDVGVKLGSDPDWTWDSGDTPDAVDTLNATARSSAYTALIPLEWTPYALKPGSTETQTNNPALYVCNQGGDEAPYPGKPFAKATALGQLQMVSAPTNNSNANDTVNTWEAWVLAQNLGTWDYEHAQATLPDDSLLTDIYGPDSTGSSGAFQYQPTWWHNTFPVPHYTICNNSGSYNTTWSQHYAPPKITLPLN